MSNFNLYHVPPGDTVRIGGLTASGTIRRRLLDIGLTEGAQATCLYQSPSGDPKAYLIRGAVIALRAEDASRIEVTAASFAPAGETKFAEIGSKELMNLNY